MKPIFFAYESIANYLGRKVIGSTLYEEKEGNSWRYDINFTDLEEKAAKCRMMVICNPHNPTGRIWT